MPRAMISALAILLSGPALAEPLASADAPAVCLHTDACGVCGGDGSTCKPKPPGDTPASSKAEDSLCKTIPNADVQYNSKSPASKAWLEYTKARFEVSFINVSPSVHERAVYLGGSDETGAPGLVALLKEIGRVEYVDPCAQVSPTCRLTDESSCFSARLADRFITGEDLSWQLVSLTVGDVWSAAAENTAGCTCTAAVMMTPSSSGGR
ncbi:MAG: hypothetical protein ACI9MC_000750 [Kiritimatiellia bacterium]|jgi:hypothetical protein